MIGMEQLQFSKCHKCKHTHFGYEQDAWDFQHDQIPGAINLINGVKSNIINGGEIVAGGKYIPLGSRFERNTGYNISAGAPWHLTCCIKYEHNIDPVLGIIAVVAKNTLISGLGIVYDPIGATLPSPGLGFAAWNVGIWVAYTAFPPGHAGVEKFHKWDAFYTANETVSLWIDDVEVAWWNKSGNPFAGVLGVRFFILGERSAQNDVAGEVKYGTFGVQ